jgi:hypothetical protein
MAMHKFYKDCPDLQKCIKSKKFCEERISHFPLMWHGRYRKWHGTQQFSYYCMCIHGYKNVFTTPLHSNVNGVHVQTCRQQGNLISLLLACLCCFEKVKGDLWNHLALCVCVCVCVSEWMSFSLRSMSYQGKDSSQSFLNFFNIRSVK